MENLPLPEKYEIKKISDYQADIIIEPCYPGYGTTIGNVLRRVLLSSLSGAAITAVNIKNISHEFSTLPGVKEDIVEILLNLKRLRFILHSVDETKISLKVKGEKKVTAKDLKPSSEIEIVSPEAVIATLTDKNAEIDMELTVKTGRGYLPVENIDKKKFSLGTIAIDAIFTPIINTNFRTENVRVGQMTNYDKIIMSITTDGTISPQEALNKSAEILVEHFAKIKKLGSSDTDKKEEKSIIEKKEIKKKTEKEILDEKTSEKADKIDMPKIKKKRGRPRKEK